VELTSAQIDRPCFCDIPANPEMGCPFRRVAVDDCGREWVPDHSAEQWLAGNREHIQPNAHLDHVGREAAIWSRTFRPLGLRAACRETLQAGVGADRR
jgi:hypothetical protein